MKLKSILLSLLTLVTALNVWAQDEPAKPKFKIDGEFRTIGEYRDGYAAPLKDELQVPASVIRSRARINFSFKNDKYETYLSIQDARAWGDQFLLKEQYKNPLNVFEAWAKYNFNEEFGVKIGRQELQYGLGRILSGRNWRDQALSHDALVFQWEKGKKMKFHVGLSKSTNSMVEWSGTYYTNTYGYHKHMVFAAYTNKLTENITLNLLDLYMSYQNTAGDPQDVKGYNTIGGNLIYNSDGLFADGTFYYQHANWGDADADKLSSMMFAVGAGYKFGKHSVKVGYDYYKGQDPESEKNTVFRSPYWAAHMFLGSMDYFMGGIPSYGVNDIYVNAEFALGEKRTLGLSIHQLGYNEDVADMDSKSVGTELGLSYSCKVAKGVVFKGGYAMMLPTDTYKMVKFGNEDTETRPAQWAWAMIIFKPTFLNQ